MFLFHFIQQVLHSNTRGLTHDQVKKLQQKKFRKLIAYASEKSSYYKDIIRKHHIDIHTATPEDFPVLTKETVIEHFDEIVTDRRITKESLSKFLADSKDPNELFLGTYYVIHTSGSSGVVGYYVYTEKELITGMVPAARAGNIRVFQKMAYIAAVKGHFAGVTMASIAKRLPGVYKKVELFDINSPFHDIIERLNNIQPTTVSGYAFALHTLAEAQKDGRLHISPHLLQTGGEPLSQDDKTYIQDVFHAPVANVYACSEHLIMGIGKDSFGGMYLMEDSLMFEIHKDYTCVTNLFNYTLPLVRYRMSDTLEPIADTVNALPFTKIKDIVGRSEYTPVFVNDDGEEDFISPILLVEFYVKHLEKFQIHLLDKKSFVFRAVLERDLNSHEKQRVLAAVTSELKRILAEKRMTNVAFRIDLVLHLEVDKRTGKFRLISKE